MTVVLNQPPKVGFATIVKCIDAMLPPANGNPRSLRWVTNDTAFIDCFGLRVVVGITPSLAQNGPVYLVITIGEKAGAGDEGYLFMSPHELTHRLVNCVALEIPYDAILSGNITQTADKTVIDSLCHDLDQLDLNQIPKTHPIHTSCAVLHHHMPSAVAPSGRRKVQRFCVYASGAIGAGLLILAPPLGAFMLTYSILRGITGRSISA